MGSDERLAFGELRCEAGDLELTTLGASEAIPLQRPLREFCINRPDFTERVLYLILPHIEFDGA